MVPKWKPLTFIQLYDRIIYMISYGYDSHKQIINPTRKRKCPMAHIPSLDTRALGAVTPPRKSYKTNHTIAPAYNKGGYQVISKSNIKDIGK